MGFGSIVPPPLDRPPDPPATHMPCTTDHENSKKISNEYATLFYPTTR